MLTQGGNESRAGTPLTIPEGGGLRHPGSVQSTEPVSNMESGSAKRMSLYRVNEMRSLIWGSPGQELNRRAKPVSGTQRGGLCGAAAVVSERQHTEASGRGRGIEHPSLRRTDG